MAFRILYCIQKVGYFCTLKLAPIIVDVRSQRCTGKGGRGQGRLRTPLNLVVKVIRSHFPVKKNREKEKNRDRSQEKENERYDKDRDEGKM